MMVDMVFTTNHLDGDSTCACFEISNKQIECQQHILTTKHDDDIVLQEEE